MEGLTGGLPESVRADIAAFQAALAAGGASATAEAARIGSAIEAALSITAS